MRYVGKFGSTLHAAAMLTAALSFSPAASAQSKGEQSVVNLIKDSATTVLGKDQLPQPAIRGRTVTIDAAALINSRPGHSIVFNLFDNAALPASIDTYWQSDATTYHWQGKLLDHPQSSFLLVMHNGAVAGLLRVPGFGTFRIRSSGKLGQIVEEIDDARFAPCGNDEKESIKPAPGPGGIADAPPAGCGTFIDVMVVYTPEARDQQGGDAAIQAIAMLGIDDANFSYSNSAINPRVRLVYVGETEYTESGSFFTELDLLTGTSDGFMDEVHTLRDQYGADLVTLLISHTQGGTICGLGWMMGPPPSVTFAQYGFNVCNADCTAGGYTMAHEMGHNMGCNHDHDNSSGPPAFDFSYGHRFTASDSQLYRTVMAYDPGNRIPNFSNPNILYLDTPTGVPAGDPAAADNAQTINLTSPMVAAFRDIGSSTSMVWPPPTQIVANDGAEGDRFGTSVAISGDLIIVGAYTDDDHGIDSGAAYIFRRDATTGAWVQEEKLSPADGAAGDRFGVSVAISNTDSGEVAIVGAFLDDDGGTDSGSAYIFRHGLNGWTQETKIVPQDLASLDSFGRSVAIARASGSDVALIGSFLDDDTASGTGSVYVYRKTGGAWEQETKLHASDPQAGDQFGFATAIGISPTGDQYALIGAYKDDDNAVDAGSAYLFKKTGSTWSQVTKFHAADPQANDQFGISVSLSFTDTSEVALIGAFMANRAVSNSGAAYVFRDSGSGWSQEIKLMPSDPGQDDLFGTVVSLSGDAALVCSYLHDGAFINSGAAYVFRKNGPGWIQEAKLSAPDAQQDDDFGFGVALEANTAVIGSWTDDTKAGADVGSVYISTAIPFIDCNNNGIPDSCDISAGTSLDVNQNGIPDECEPPPPTCPSDIAPPGGDGVVNTADLLAIINSWGACADPNNCPADINNDDVVNTGDLLAIINAWGACP